MTGLLADLVGALVVALLLGLAFALAGSIETGGLFSNLP